MIQVKVADGRVVRDARGHAVPTGGFEVNERDMFWSRLLRDGDVVLVTTAAPAAVKTPAAAASAEKAS